MAPKKKGALPAVQEDTVLLERQVDTLIQDFKKQTLSDRTHTSQRCSDLQVAVTVTLTKLQNLTKADELAPVGDYDQMKRALEERLTTLQRKLYNRAQTIQPQDNSVQEDSEEDSEDEEEEEEQALQEEDDELLSDDQSGVCYRTLSSFTGQEDGDLTVQKGAVVRILRRSDDGWWLARNSEGKEGLVPRNYLQRMSCPHDGATDPDDEDDEDVDGGDRDEDDEDDDDDSKDSDNIQEDEGQTVEEKPSSLSNWKTVRKIDATDVLSVMGVIPSAFRPSTLSKLLAEGSVYRASHYIQPKLRQSELSFKDLQLDPNNGKVLAQHSGVCVTVTLWSCRMISPPGVGLSVLSRHIRLCAFNGTEVLSNIHTVRAICTSSSPRTWSFSPRMSSPLSCLLDGDCFFRCDSDSPDLGILFELGVTYIRNSTGERGDLSCGWAFLKLSDENGAVLPPRTYELAVNGGTPFERVVDTSSLSSSKRGGSTGVFHQMLMSRKLPKLIIKLRSPNTRTKEQLSLLPDTLLGCVSTVPLLALYRQLLADTLLLERITMQNADLICSPVLATFPEVLDQTDLLDAFRKSWLESENNLKRSDKKDVSVLKRLFESVYMSSVFPLLFSAEIPAPFWANEDTESRRARLIYDPAHKITLETTLSSNHKHQAFNMSQVSYDLLTSAWN